METHGSGAKPLTKKNQYEDLTEQQIKFAESYLQFNNATTAAIKAGYSEKTAASQGSRLLKNVKIRELIDSMRTQRQEAVANKLASYAADIVPELYELAKTAESESVRLQAMKDILDRGGFKPVEKRDNTNTLDGKIEFSFIDPNEE